MYKVEWKVIKNIGKNPLVGEIYTSPEKAVASLTKKSRKSKSYHVLIDENKGGFQEKNIKKKISDLKMEVLKIQTAVKKREFEKIKKLEYKKCPNCGSKIKTSFLKNIDCLVCSKPMLSAPSKTKLLEIQNKLKVEQNRLETVQKNSKKYYIKVAIKIEGK